MHALNLYINETLEDNSVMALRSELMSDSHVVNVAFHNRQPHDMLVEYDETFVQPTSIINQIASHGFHVDVVGG